MTLVRNIIFQKLPTKDKHKTQNKRIIFDPVEYHRIFVIKKSRNYLFYAPPPNHKS